MKHKDIPKRGRVIIQYGALIARSGLAAALLLIFCLTVSGCAGQPSAGFAVYLVKQPMSGQRLQEIGITSVELASEPIISTDDIIFYSAPTHEIELTAEAYTRVRNLFTVPVKVDGMPFVVCVGGERIYGGAFWTPLSSLSFDGVYVLQPFEAEPHVIRLALGYPARIGTGGADPRSDPRIIQALRSAGKLKLSDKDLLPFRDAQKRPHIRVAFFLLAPMFNAFPE